MEAFAGFFFIIGCIMFAVFYVTLYLPLIAFLWVIHRLRRGWKTQQKVKEIQKMSTQPEVQRPLEEGITKSVAAELKRAGLDPANFSPDFIRLNFSKSNGSADFNLNRPGADFVQPPPWRGKFYKVLKWILAIVSIPIAIGFIKGMLSHKL